STGFGGSTGSTGAIAFSGSTGFGGTAGFGGGGGTAAFGSSTTFAGAVSPAFGAPGGAPPLASAMRLGRPRARSSGPNASLPRSAVGSVSSPVYDSSWVADWVACAAR